MTTHTCWVSSKTAIWRPPLLPCHPSSSTLGTTRSHPLGARIKRPSQAQRVAAAALASHGNASWGWSQLFRASATAIGVGLAAAVEQSRRFQGRFISAIQGLGYFSALLLPPPLPLPHLLLPCQEDSGSPNALCTQHAEARCPAANRPH